MVVEKDGDILTSGADIICHQVNCMGVMGAGLAKQIRDKYPHTYAQYKIKCNEIKAGVGGLGDVMLCDEGDCIIANLFAQYRYGRDRRYTDYDALRKCLHETVGAAERWSVVEDKRCRIALPYGLGCGLAGGDWGIVRNIIEEIFGGGEYRCEIWKYNN